MDSEDAKSYTKRKLKVYAYRKSRRLIRKRDKRASTGGNDSMAMTMMRNSDTDSSDSESREKSREERKEKNKDWRKRRELSRWESCGLEPPQEEEPEEDNDRTTARQYEKQLVRLLTCSKCRICLTSDIWECEDGHPTCEHCFDRDNIGREIVKEDINGSEVVKEDTLSKNDSLTSIATMTSIATIASIRESLVEMAQGNITPASWEKYRLEDIDFFLGTLEVRKDAIGCYGDYNNQFKSIFYNPDLEDLDLTKNGEGLDDDDDAFERNSRVEAYLTRLRELGSLASLKTSLIDIAEVNEEDLSPAWAKFRLEEIDFFLNTLDIKKDAISYYGDYNNKYKSIFTTRNIDDDDEEDEYDATDGSSDENQEEISERKYDKITKCNVCQKFIYKRNLQLERIGKIFFQLN